MNAWDDADRADLGARTAASRGGRCEAVLDNGDHQWQFMF